MLWHPSVVYATPDDRAPVRPGAIAALARREKKMNVKPCGGVTTWVCGAPNQRRYLAAFGPLLAVLLAAMLCSAVDAATITVTGVGDTTAVDGSVTLREAITSINNGANVNADVVAVGVYGT